MLQTIQQSIPQHAGGPGYVHDQSPTVFDHPRSGFEHRLLNTLQVPAAAGRSFQFAAQHPG